MNALRIYKLSILCSLIFANFVFAIDKTEAAKKEIADSIDAKQAEYADIAKQIWGFAELAFTEVKSSSLLQSKLKEAGFSVEAGVAGLETAFVATYGKGKPIIGIIAEFDALPGMSQQASPECNAIVEGGNGHGCGHNLFGTGSMAAAIAVKDWLAKSGFSGTIRVYGTPAEEKGGAKIQMALAGVFDDADVILCWHPQDENNASPQTTIALISAKFRFYGVSSHASVAPERGRSALNGVEAMNYMVNMMREHIPSEARIHYVITQGGVAPNVVPDFAEVYYFVREYKIESLKDIWLRVVDAADGAAKGTGTRVEYEIVSGNHSMLANDTLAGLMDKNLRLVGGVKYNDEEKVFAEAISKTLGKDSRDLATAQQIQPYEPKNIKGSTDAGDVSMIAPTAEVLTATWVPGTTSHTWQATAASGTSIGTKGMIVAAKTMAFTAVDIFMDPSYAEQARKELEEKRGTNFKYHPLPSWQPELLF
ncbi:MAG: amidohydrolase [Phycisphaerae bacterium]|jgi:aminobenzoyl-glutamate utilization protein B